MEHRDTLPSGLRSLNKVRIHLKKNKKTEHGTIRNLRKNHNGWLSPQDGRMCNKSHMYITKQHDNDISNDRVTDT